MSAKWHNSFKLKTVDEQWDWISGKPGVYVVRCSTSIRCAANVDSNGVLYVGRSSDLHHRLCQLWNADHLATWFLWKYPEVASLLLGKSFQSKEEVGEYLGELTVTVAMPVQVKALQKAERAVLWAYLTHFGELPPLNSGLSRRWATPPSDEEIAWAARGLQ